MGAPKHGRPLRVMALDVALLNTGVVIFDDLRPLHAGCIRTTTTKQKPRNAGWVVQSMRWVHEMEYMIDAYVPNVIVAELPTGGARGANANRAGGQVFGMFGGLMARHGEIPYAIIQPRHSKECCTGDSKASKEEVQEAVCKCFPGLEHCVGVVTPAGKREHCYDAAAAWWTFSEQHGDGLLWELGNEEGGLCA